MLRSALPRDAAIPDTHRCCREGGRRNAPQAATTHATPRLHGIIAPVHPPPGSAPVGVGPSAQTHPVDTTPDQSRRVNASSTPPCRRPPGKTPAHCYWILTLDRFCAFAESRHRHSTYEHDNYPSSRQNDKGSIVRIQDNTWRLAANCFSANSSFVGRTARVVCNMVTRSAAARPGADSSHNGAHGDHQPYRRRRQATTEAASKPRVAGSGKIVTVASPSPPVTR